MPIIEKPIITEKSLAAAGRGVYTFAVSLDATTSEIAKEVARLYKVNVLAVRSLTVKGQVVRRKTGLGKTKDRKKALVTLKKGQKIDGFAFEEEKTAKRKKDKE